MESMIAASDNSLEDSEGHIPFLPLSVALLIPGDCAPLIHSFAPSLLLLAMSLPVYGWLVCCWLIR